MTERRSGITTFECYINGKWVPSSKDQYFDSIDPFIGKAWALIPKCSIVDVDKAVGAAKQALTAGEWAEMHASARGKLMRRLADLIARDAEHLARIEVQDNGKLFAEMKAQVSYIPEWLYYFGGLADKIEGSVLPIDKADMFTYTRHEPIGVVAAITPWNSPLLLTMWKLAPALAAGCTLVLKPSEYTSASTLVLMKLVEETGFPAGVINVVTGFGQDVGEALTTHPDVDKIAFTGGEGSGRHIAKNAANSFKRMTLELGGKSAQLIFPDANLDNAVRGVVSGIFAASGQTCIAGSRVLVHESIHDVFLEKFIAMASAAKMGDPMSLQTQVGPVTTRPQFEKILSCIENAQAEGATCVLGGKMADRPECGDGWFIEPTVFIDVTNDMTVAQEEIFGPVLSVIKFKEDEEAYNLANDTDYGLAAGIWTTDPQRMFAAAKKVRAGNVWTNSYRTVSYMAPFGGFKSSGIGRESGQEAIWEYLETKCVWIDYGDEQPNPFVLR